MAVALFWIFWFLPQETKKIKCISYFFLTLSFSHFSGKLDSEKSAISKIYIMIPKPSQAISSCDGATGGDRMSRAFLLQQWFSKYSLSGKKGPSDQTDMRGLRCNSTFLWKVKREVPESTQGNHNEADLRKYY